MSRRNGGARTRDLLADLDKLLRHHETVVGGELEAWREALGRTRTELLCAVQAAGAIDWSALKRSSYRKGIAYAVGDRVQTRDGQTAEVVEVVQAGTGATYRVRFDGGFTVELPKTGLRPAD